MFQGTFAGQYVRKSLVHCWLVFAIMERSTFQELMLLSLNGSLGAFLAWSLHFVAAVKRCFASFLLACSLAVFSPRHLVDAWNNWSV